MTDSTKLISNLKNKLNERLKVNYKSIKYLGEQGDTYGACCGSLFEGIADESSAFEKVIDFLDEKRSDFRDGAIHHENTDIFADNSAVYLDDEVVPKIRIIDEESNNEKQKQTR